MSSPQPDLWLDRWLPTLRRHAGDVTHKYGLPKSLLELACERTD